MLRGKEYEKECKNVASIKNKLAEIYFDRDENGKPKIFGHCYVKKEEYKTKQEQKWIEQDIKRARVVYRNKKI